MHQTNKGIKLNSSLILLDSMFLNTSGFMDNVATGSDRIDKYKKKTIKRVFNQHGN